MAHVRQQVQVGSTVEITMEPPPGKQVGDRAVLVRDNGSYAPEFQWPDGSVRNVALYKVEVAEARLALDPYSTVRDPHTGSYTECASIRYMTVSTKQGFGYVSVEELRLNAARSRRANNPPPAAVAAADANPGFETPATRGVPSVAEAYLASRAAATAAATTTSTTTTTPVYGSPVVGGGGGFSVWFSVPTGGGTPPTGSRLLEVEKEDPAEFFSPIEPDGDL
jgi:hypothetical protein